MAMVSIRDHWSDNPPPEPKSIEDYTRQYVIGDDGEAHDIRDLVLTVVDKPSPTSVVLMPKETGAK